MAKENQPLAEERPAAEEKPAVAGSLLDLVRAARVATVAQIQLTPLDELNRVRVKLQVCEELLNGLPAAAISGTRT